MQKINLRRQLVEFLRSNPLQILTILWVGFLVAAFLTAGYLLPHSSKNVLAADLTGDPGTTNVSRNNLVALTSYADIVQRVAPAVVTVRSERKASARSQDVAPFMNDPMFRQFFGNRMPNMQQPRAQRALGSGVIIEANGTILTNNHVVEGADKVRVELPDRRTFEAKVIGADKLSDLAVLKVEADNLPVLALGNSDQVRVGDVVLAIGYPLGLRQTVTSGIISAKGRSTGVSDGSFEDFLQTDAPINHGNSGGALINLNGELIGINSQILSPSGGSIGIGFAIPSNMARGVMDQLVKNGKVQRGMLGVGIQNITSDLANSLGLKDISGVLINSVKTGGPADKAGIKQGDVVTALNTMKIIDSNEFRNKVAQTAPGNEVNLTILRDGKELNIRAALTEYTTEKASFNIDNEDQSDDSTGNPTNSPKSDKLGLTLEPLTPQIAAQIGLKNQTKGLVVSEVQSGSPADDAGLAEGDVIQQINRQTVNSMSDVKAALANSSNKPVLVLVNRQGQSLFLTIQQ